MIVPGSAERVDRVVEQVRPHLVELRAVDRQRRQRAVVVALELDLGVLELVAQDLERRLEALVDVGLDDPAAVHVGVGLDRTDQASSSARSTRAGRSTSRWALSDAATEPQRRRRGRSRPMRASARATPSRLRRQPAAQRVATRRARRAPPAGRASRPRRRRRRAPTARCARRTGAAPGRAGRRSGRRPRARCRPATNSLSVAPITSSASASSAAERRAADAGLFSSCASPAAIVPSAASRSRFCSIAVKRAHSGPDLAHDPADAPRGGPAPGAGTRPPGSAPRAPA